MVERGRKVGARGAANALSQLTGQEISISMPIAVMLPLTVGGTDNATDLFALFNDIIKRAPPQAVPQQHDLAKYAQQANDIQKSYKPYTLLDCKFLWQHKNLNIFLQANNLFDVRYFDFGNIIQPGRWMSAGFHWHIPLRQKI